MLTYEQIITLSDKGFSPEQIVKLTEEELPEPEKKPEEEPETKPEEQKQEPEKKPEEEQKTEPEKDSPLSALQEVFKSFAAEVAEMRKALQASNIRTEIREDIPPSATADDILAGIIHPTINKEDSKK